MPQRFTERFDQGLNASDDRKVARPGEMQQATGGFYKPGDSVRLHQLGGRTAFADTGSASKIKGGALLQFDAGGSDKLVAFSGTTLYGSATGLTGTFSNLKTGLSSSATELDSAHANNRWYLVNGVDRGVVVESDGTVRDMSMLPPNAPITAATTTNSTVSRPSADDSDFTNGSNFYDADQSTFGYANLSAAGSVDTVISGFSGGTVTETLQIKWALTGAAFVDPGTGTSYDPFGDAGGQVDAGYNVTVKLEVSTDGGSTFPTTILNRTSTSAITFTTEQVMLTSVTRSNVQVKATLTYNSGINPAQFRIYDVRMQDGSSVTAFDITSIYYAITEYDETRGLEGPSSGSVQVANQTSKTGVTLTLPATAANSTATHFRIYRTADNGTSPNQLGRIGSVSVGETSFFDDFITFGKDTQPFPLYPLLQVLDPISQEPKYYERKTPSPALSRIFAYQGSLVGIDANNPRTLRYSIAGEVESWPEIYVIPSHDLEEHDVLVDGIVLGETLVLGASGAMLRVEGLARTIAGQYNPGRSVPIQGAPGCVGSYAMSKVNVGGRSAVAWIAEDGIYFTDGITFESISEDIDWSSIVTFAKSKWSLTWWQKYRILRFDYSASDGAENNRYYLLHFGKGNTKANGLPKVTGPHYGAATMLAGGVISGQIRLYSFHNSDGKVYVEDNTSATTDASNAYDGSGTWPLIVKSRRMYNDRHWSLLDAYLHHTDFGGSAAATVAVESGRDTGSSSTRSQSVSLVGNKGTHFGIRRSGEWHETTITYTGGRQGALTEMRYGARGLGDTGTID